MIPTDEQIKNMWAYHTEQTRPIMESEKAITAGRHRLAEAP